MSPQLGRKQRVSFCMSAIAALLVAAVAIPVVSSTRTSKARQLVHTTTARYSVSQGGRTVGSETVVTRAYDNNTVVIHSTIQINLEGAVGWVEEAELELEEESFFVRSLHMKKVVKQGDREFDHVIDLRMYANVAVVETRLQTSEERRNVVVPTGTALVDMGTVYPVAPLLHWYDREAGGTQAFSVLEVGKGQPSQTSIHISGERTVNVAGSDVRADVFEMQREDVKTTALVDEKGRVVQVELGYMTFNLDEMTVESAVGE